MAIESRIPQRLLLVVLVLLCATASRGFVLLRRDSEAMSSFQLLRSNAADKKRHLGYTCNPLLDRSSTSLFCAVGEQAGEFATRRQRDDNNLVMIFDWTCILKADEYFIQLGMDAAFHVWPQLQQRCDLTDLDWLRNKLAAISIVLPHPNKSEFETPSSSSSSYHLACEYALATRLFLEEQVLDRNQSTGKKGKYARKFHPRQDLPTDASSSTSGDDTSASPAFPPTLSTGTSKTGTRPLTVGEVSTNWRDSLRETLLIKYNVNGKPPLTVLEQAVADMIRKQTSQNALTIFPQVKFALRNSSHRILMQVQHSLDYPIVLASLKAEGIDFQAAHSVQAGMAMLNTHPSSIVVFLQTSDLMNDNVASCPSDYDTLLQVLKCSNFNDTTFQDDEKENDVAINSLPLSVVRVDPSWYSLEPLVPLFGDYIPRHGTNQAKCIVPNTLLSLYVSKWTAAFGIDPTAAVVDTRNAQHEAAMIHPWTDVLSWDNAESMLLCSSNAKMGTTFQ
jgi:hypothetical protein